MMKKTIAILLSLVMILGLAACGNSASQTEQPSMEENSVESTVGIEESAESIGTDTENTDAPESQLEGTNAPDAQESKILVAYFSATGTTEGVAEHIANGLNADIYEIVPEEAYTDADLDYNDNNSRTTIEMNDPNARPVISGSVENMEQYDTVFIGYPIWGGEKHRELSVLSWRAMIFPAKPSYLSVHLAEVISAPVQPAWNSSQTELLGLMDGG